jgi:predicted O-methyltransferase YrrM
MENLININKALQIEGMMSEEELLWIATEAAKYKRIVELGSYFGRSTRAIADNTKGRVIAIDNWMGPKERLMNYSDRILIFDKFKQNLEDLLQNGKVTTYREDFGVLPQITFNRPPDMIFLDGDHSYDAVIRDINWAISVMRDGGLLCGHDIDMKEVKMGVYDKFKFHDVNIPKNAELIWFVNLPKVSYGAMNSMKNGEITIDAQTNNVWILNN